MATITPSTASAPQSSSAAEDRTRSGSSLRKTTVVVGVVAAAATAAVAAALHAAGASFEIDGEMIPLVAFAQMAFLGAVIGGVLAGSLRKRSAHARDRFVQVTVALTALTCIPSIALPPEAATKVALVVTHLVAAAIVIPVLARRLAD